MYLLLQIRVDTARNEHSEIIYKVYLLLQIRVDTAISKPTLWRWTGVSTITNKGRYSRLYILNDEFAGVSTSTNKCMYIFDF